MSDLKLVYFEGCPNAKHARAALLSSGIEFDTVMQNDLEEESPLLNFSSPTILNGDEIIYGHKIDKGSSACSIAKFSEDEIIKELAKLKTAGSGKTEGRAMKNKLLKIGCIGVVITALCCFTPLLVVFLVAIGFAGIIVYLDYVLLPLLGFFVILTCIGIYRMKKGDDIAGGS